MTNDRECEWCRKAATTNLTAYWGVFTMVEWRSCDEHFRYVLRELAQTYIEGRVADSHECFHYEPARR